ncbi:hypothetical protein GQ457_02G017130 [Hibiscus cannabinus]
MWTGQLMEALGMPGTGCFAKSVGVFDAPTDKIIVVREACKLFCASKWASFHKLFIESESDRSNVVCWIQNPSTAPSSLKQSILSCVFICAGCDWIISLIPRELNILTKRGILLTYYIHQRFYSVCYGSCVVGVELGKLAQHITLA